MQDFGFLNIQKVVIFGTGGVGFNGFISILQKRLYMILC